MNAAADLLLGQKCKEALDLVEPRGSCRGQVNVPMRPLGEPSAYLLGLVSCVVVHDDMNFKIGWHSDLDAIQEPPELRRAMARIALANDPPGGDIQRGEQGCDAMPGVIMGTTLRLARTHG